MGPRKKPWFTHFAYRQQFALSTKKPMPWPNKERWSRRRGDFLRLKKRFKSSPFGPLSSSGLLHFHITSTFLSNFSLIFLTILRNSSQFFPICFLSFFFSTNLHISFLLFFFCFTFLHFFYIFSSLSCSLDSFSSFPPFFIFFIPLLPPFFFFFLLLTKSFLVFLLFLFLPTFPLSGLLTVSKPPKPNH